MRSHKTRGSGDENERLSSNRACALRRHLNELAANHRQSGVCKLKELLALPQYKIIILFFSKGSFVVQALAGPGNVTYELGADAGAAFAISSSSGNITILANLDREVSYKLFSN